ncbi:hypothetical protein ACS0TY_005824 [Phlomoides rotata]
MERVPASSSRGPNQKSCIIEFDGASKGNPGHAGAGAVVRLEDGTPEYNSAADNQANRGVHLNDGEIHVEYD